MIGLYDSKLSLAIRNNINAEINNKMWARLPANLIVDMVSSRVGHWILCIMQKCTPQELRFSRMRIQTISERYFRLTYRVMIINLSANKIIKTFSSKHDKFTLLMAMSISHSMIESILCIIEMKLKNPEQKINYKKLAIFVPQVLVVFFMQYAFMNSVNHLNYESPKYAICKNMLHSLLKN